MIELISSLFGVGDYIRILFNNSSKYVEGSILKFGTDSIAIETPDGKICGIKGNDINSFERDPLPPSNKDANTDASSSSSSSLSPTHSEDATANEEKENESQSTAIVASIDSAKQTISSTKEDVHQYKPGDRIPMDELYRIDPKLKNKTSVAGKGTYTSVQQKSSRDATSDSPSDPSAQDEQRTGREVERLSKKNKLTVVSRGSDFSGLGVLVEDEHRKEDLKVVPARGEIKFIKLSEGYGFIIDPTIKKDVHFKISEIVDDPSQLTPNTPVVYSLQERNDDVYATTIHRPMQIDAMLKKAAEFEKEDNEDKNHHALNLAKQILDEYSENYSASAYLKTIENSYSKERGRKYVNYYAKARESQLKNKDYQKAIEYYKKAIDERQNLGSAIKDLGWLFVSFYKSTGDDTYREDALQLMEEHSEELPDTITTWNYLESFYFAVAEYDLFINEADKLLDCQEVIKKRERRLNLLTKKIIAYIRKGNINEAESIVDEALSIDPKATGVLGLKSAIENNTEKEDIGDKISEVESIVLDEMGLRGVSKFIHNLIENYEEYAGVPPKVIESSNFTKETLDAVKKIGERAGSGRPRERAKYLLTEGKLISILMPEDTRSLRNVMARYCNAMALCCISDYRDRDTIRFYYNEAFALEETYSSNLTQIRIYLYTLYCSNEELQRPVNDNISFEKISLDELLNRSVSLGLDIRCWDEILSMFISNKEIASKIIFQLYADEGLKKSSLSALEQFNGERLSPTITRRTFEEEWDKAIDKRKREYNQVSVIIQELGGGRNADLVEVCAKLPSLMNTIKGWMTQLDESRIRTIGENIQIALDTYIKSTGYRNKETNKNYTLVQVTQLIDDIRNNPTKLSYEVLLPLLEKICSLVEDSFKKVIALSTPKVAIELLSTETVVNKNSEVSIQISVSNDKDSSPIKEVSVGIEKTDIVETIEDGEILYNAIDGGDRHIFKLRIKVADEVSSQGATALDVVCKYKSGDTEKTETAKCSLKLYSADDYKKIDNPYAPFADGGPVPTDSNMFYGREEFIANIVDSIIRTPSKQIIIYGQKRCGKSSVMTHLKKELIETGKIFCVYFSLGEIINNLTETAFYHKILSSISDELDKLRMDDDTAPIPQFNIPMIREFKGEDEDNPLNTFMKYMIKFKTLCKQTEGWQDKRLVVMIDEFTYLYTQIKRGEVSTSIMKQWKAITQNEKAQFSVVLVGQDVIPSFKKEDYARNAFGVIQDIRLTYLEEKPARALIEDPIRGTDGRSRYIGDAVSKIIDYTSRNPYYIQIFCSRLVDYMNTNKLISVTEADVENVVNSFVAGSEALGEEKFDNLIRAGETEDIQEFDDKDILDVLRQISLLSKNIRFCKRSDVRVLDDKKKEDNIFKHLTDREVLEKQSDDNYKIQVKLFQEWLLNH